MGITPDAQTNTISTIYKTSSTTSNATINHLAVIHTMVDITHLNKHQSVLRNTGKRSLKWKAMFYGNYKMAYANGKPIPVKKETDDQSKKVSFIEITVQPGKAVSVKVED
jgi:hypothetical protein